MPVLKCLVSDETYARLRMAAQMRGRGPEAIEEMAENAIAEAALADTRDHPAFSSRPHGFLDLGSVNIAMTEQPDGSIRFGS